MPLGRNQTVLSSNRNNEDDLVMDINVENLWGEVNNQNLYGY